MGINNFLLQSIKYCKFEKCIEYECKNNICEKIYLKVALLMFFHLARRGKVEQTG